MSRSRAHSPVAGAVLGALAAFTIAAGFAVIGAGAMAAPAAAPTPPRLSRAVGVTLNPGPRGAAQAYRLFAGAGATALEAPQPWATLAPSPGRFHLGDVSAIVRGVQAAPADQVMVIPAAIETTARSVPRDLRAVPWDSPRMIGRYRALLGHLAPRLSRQVRYVSIANEADVYLTAHPSQLPAFVRFARIELAQLHRLAPWVRAGVTVTYSGLTSAHPRIARMLAALGGATIVTYYPVGGGYWMRAPSAPLTDVPRMVRLAHGRPLIVQEAGYASARGVHGSPAAQATFVRDLFTAWNQVPNAIPFLSFYELFDLPARECRARAASVRFLCSLGLRRRDGEPKPAWSAFRAGIRALSAAPRAAPAR